MRPSSFWSEKGDTYPFFPLLLLFETFPLCFHGGEIDAAGDGGSNRVRRVQEHGRK